MLTAVSIALVLFCGFAIIHPLLFHLIRTERKFSVLIGLFLLECIVFFTISFYRPVEDPRVVSHLLVLMVSFLTFSFLWLGYLIFYSSAERGVSIRIMAQIASHGEAIELNELKKRYRFDDVIQRRVGVMLANGLLEVIPNTNESETDVKYINSTRGAYLGQFAEWYKRLLRIGDGG